MKSFVDENGAFWMIADEEDQGVRRCPNCEKLGVTDSSNIYITCDECAEWKTRLQEKPGYQQEE